MKTFILLFLPLLSFSQNPYLDSLYREYHLLKIKDAQLEDSINLQKSEIEDLLVKIRIGEESAIKLKKEQEKIEEMKRTIERYKFQIDSLNRENERLKEKQLRIIEE